MTGNVRGAAAVALLDTVPDVEATAVLCLRLWCDGPEAQAGLWNEVAVALGAPRGRAALKAFERLVGLVVRHGRRPLMRHQLACRCIGADEAVFGGLVAAAANGDAAEARLFAGLLVGPEHVAEALGLAREAGPALRVLARPTVAAPAPGATLH